MTLQLPITPNRRQAMGLCCDRERTVMGSHDQFSVFKFLPEQRAREVNGIESSQLRRHRLCRPLKNGGTDFNELKGCNHFENRSPTARYLRIGKFCPNAEAIQRPQTFDRGQRARNSLTNLAPLAQGIGLPESETE